MVLSLMSQGFDADSEICRTLAKSCKTDAKSFATYAKRLFTYAKRLFTYAKSFAGRCLFQKETLTSMEKPNG
jgi:hypothetical protein